jgi:signal transduction histidine kinase
MADDRNLTILPLSSVPPKDDSAGISSRHRGPASQVEPLAPELSAYLPVIVEILPVPVLVIDDRFRLVLANAAARRFLSSEDAACVGQSVGRYLSLEKLGAARLTLLSQLGAHCYRDVVFVDDVEREIDIQIECLDAGGRELLCASFLDASEGDRARAEWADSPERSGPESSGPQNARIDHAHRMEALGQLTGSFAHDFNNLLSVTLGSLESAERRLEQNKDPSEDIGRARKATERSIQTTAEILRYARSRPPELEPICPRRLLEDLQGLVERALGGSVLVHFELRDTPKVRVGPAQLETAILNLIINARDAVEDGGEIRVVLGQRALGEGEATQLGLLPGQHVTLAVVDSGHGMTEEVRRRVFEPFYTTKPQGRGTGLGLSTVRAVARRYDGAVELETSPGRGTRVELIFPAF